jgi:nitroreductase
VDFLEVVGTRRSIRWFRPWQPVEQDKLQRILEAARLTSCPGNMQPWRALVLRQSELEPERRRALCAANNFQRAQELAPVWIYWYADPDALAPAALMDRVRELLPAGAIPGAFGWSEEVAGRSIERGDPAPAGLPALEELSFGLPVELRAVVAAQETNGAVTVAALAAVNEGLGTCLHMIAAPSRQSEVKERLGVPAHMVPVWLQLVGYPAESADAGGQRPRAPFEQLFWAGAWGRPFPRESEVVQELERRRLLQAPAPRRGRDEELEGLARMFGYEPG